MRRLLAFLFPVLLGQCVDGSMPAQMTPPRDQRIDISSIPVALDSSDPARRRIGALTLKGAWHLTSTARGFGGLSALDVDANRVTALGDNGTVVRFRLGQFGNASDASVMRVPTGCGRATHKTDNDTESLTHDEGRGHWWIGFEWRNAVCRTNADFTSGQMVRVPKAIGLWHPKSGAESMVRLSDGRFLLIAESVSATTGFAKAILFDRDPTDPAAVATSTGYRPPPGFKPTDVAQLPDGRLLVLNRRFTVWSLFQAKLIFLSPIDLRPDAIMQGRLIANFKPPVIADNFEGLSVTVENGRPMVWLVSDNNFMRWQRTLLLKFEMN